MCAYASSDDSDSGKELIFKKKQKKVQKQCLNSRGGPAGAGGERNSYRYTVRGITRTHALDNNCLFILQIIMSASPLLLGSLLFFLSTVSALPSLQPPPPPPAPPIPTWPDLFNIKFVVYVEEYGPDWKHIGHMYYNWNKKVMQHQKR